MKTAMQGRPWRAAMLAGFLFGVAWIGPAAAQAQGHALRAAETARSAMDLNKATRAEIEAVRSVGVELAERLLVARSDRPFADWVDARRRVKGLGKRALAGFAEAGFHIGGQVPAAPTGP